MDPRWTRLGELVHAERLRLGQRHQGDFAARIGISRRVLSDIERGARTRYRAETLAAVEAALGWEPGDIGRVVAGGQPTRVDDENLFAIRALWPRLPVRARRALRAAAEQLARD